MRPLLAVSMGDPAGIGPEVTVKAASVGDVRHIADLVVVGDPLVLERAAHECGVDLRIVLVSAAEEARERPDQLPVLPKSELADIRWAHPTAASDRAQVDYVRGAFDLVIAEQADAIVTAPINKTSLSRAGAKWTGHTEMLAAFSEQARPTELGWDPVMMLAGPTLKVVPLTTHLALADVPKNITKDRVLHAIHVIDDAFKRYFGRKRPRIAVAGLNPHAGEGGLFGDEEQQNIQPAIEEARASGIEATGPFPGDTIFHRAVAGEYDCVIGMYHDQALIPIKLLDFDRAVNVTLGLPVIRTSVDHGTAYDIAGHGVASARSMIEALRLAARMRGDDR